MMVQSAVFMPGMDPLPHHHSGVEAVYVLEGEACYETPTRAAKLQKGETLALPGDTPMRAVVTGSARRHVLAVIVHDAVKDATMRMEEGTGPSSSRASSGRSGDRHRGVLPIAENVASRVTVVSSIFSIGIIAS